MPLPNILIEPDNASTHGEEEGDPQTNAENGEVRVSSASREGRLLYSPTINVAKIGVMPPKPPNNDSLDRGQFGVFGLFWFAVHGFEGNVCHFSIPPVSAMLPPSWL